MDELFEQRAACRSFLARLRNQIENLLPQQPQYGYSSEQIPLERLPVIAALIKSYIEGVGILASIPIPPVTDQ